MVKCKITLKNVDTCHQINGHQINRVVMKNEEIKIAFKGKNSEIIEINWLWEAMKNEISQIVDDVLGKRKLVPRKPLIIMDLGIKRGINLDNFGKIPHWIQNNQKLDNW